MCTVASKKGFQHPYPDSSTGKSVSKWRSQEVSGYPNFRGYGPIIDQRLFVDGGVLETASVLFEHLEKDRMARCSRFIVSYCPVNL